MSAVDGPVSDVHSLAGEALALLDEDLPVLDKLDNLPTVRALLARIQAVADGIGKALGDIAGDSEDGVE